MQWPEFAVGVPPFRGQSRKLLHFRDIYGRLNHSVPPSRRIWGSQVECAPPPTWGGRNCEYREQFRVEGRSCCPPTRNASQLSLLRHFDLPALGEVISGFLSRDKSSVECRNSHVYVWPAKSARASTRKWPKS